MPVEWLDWVEGKRVVEFGCGSGGALEKVREKLPGAELVGVDPDAGALERARERLGGGVELVRSTAQDADLGPGSFDAALFILSVHEVYSETGREGALSCFKRARASLKAGGAIIARDHCAPEPGKVEFVPPTPALRKALLRFAEAFRGRQVRLQGREDGSPLVEGADLYEFLTKYRDLDSDWEMHEIHFPFDEPGWRGVLEEAGFSVERFERWERRIEADEFLPEGWVLEGAELALLARAR